MSAGSLDLAAIARAARAAACAVLKRERLSREARERLADARRRQAQAEQQAEVATQALAEAQSAYRAAIAASVQARSAPGREILACVRHCERSAQAVGARNQVLAQAQAAVRQAQAETANCSQAWARAEHRLSQAREQVQAWKSRRLLAVDMHADLALEDEPSASRKPLDDGRAMRGRALSGTSAVG